MKQVRLSIPTSALFDASVLPDRFFRNNGRLDILRVFAVADRTAILIAEVHRRSRLYSEEELAEQAAELRGRYNLEHYEVLDVDKERKVYTVLLRAHIPDVLQDAWQAVGSEAFLDGPVRVDPEKVSLSFLILGDTKGPFELLDAAGVPYDVQTVRKGPAEGLGVDLTREQRALLRLALDLGYYEVPARVNLTALARYTGVSKAAVSKKLRRAERRALSRWLGSS
ncbi:MAG TPA: helix-turn-helix domain-containing protein [Candidatus Thermoplasmatota archaeon]